jgi:hypothetical protein
LIDFPTLTSAEAISGLNSKSYGLCFAHKANEKLMFRGQPRAAKEREGLASCCDSANELGKAYAYGEPSYY